MELHTYYQKRAKLRFALGTILLLFALYGIYKSGKDLVIGQLLLVLTASAICYIAGWRQLSFSKQQERTT
ncbi:hypothetical protein MUG87_11470 [Ectobacillus sp. JY-23]|uniref:hypothetical protein n=1 Tax=Ectobacillus sp. JY-23 TaxID=2933872 RepID=UPI001FF41A19|nr:hypothetical protein [Ectobacillus sp. JY-23]UOY91179.1 hypothetical protein MUG87_11470 [Ectobacillus sp. JY-23]